MTPTNIDPPQPQGQGEYPITALVPSTIHVFQNQAEYTAKTGKPAPQWNPALPKKGWIDITAPVGTFAMLAYHTAHLDASFQHPIVTDITVPSFLAGAINLPPDIGTYPQSTGGEYLTPIRALLANEKLVPRQMGLFDVVNTDIYDPTAPPQSSTGGGLTTAEHNMLFAIGAAMGITGA